MKFEYHGRWLRLRLELFPPGELRGSIRAALSPERLAARRKMLRRIQAQLKPPLTAT